MRAALDRSDKAGIATLTMRGKEYLTALRAQPDVLVLHTCTGPTRCATPPTWCPNCRSGAPRAAARELRTAEQLIDALTIDWDPADYHDTYAERVERLVAAKRKGEGSSAKPAPPEATNVIDLMEALSRSVEQSRSRGGKDSSGKGGRKDGGGKRAVGREQPAGPKRKERKEPEERKERTEDLTALSKAELYERASAAGVPGRSKMTREQLVEALGGSGAAA